MAKGLGWDRYQNDFSGGQKRVSYKRGNTQIVVYLSRSGQITAATKSDQEKGRQGDLGLGAVNKAHLIIEWLMEGAQWEKIPTARTSLT